MEKTIVILNNLYAMIEDSTASLKASKEKAEKAIELNKYEAARQHLETAERHHYACEFARKYRQYLIDGMEVNEVEGLIRAKFIEASDSLIWAEGSRNEQHYRLTALTLMDVAMEFKMTLR